MGTVNEGLLFEGLLPVAFTQIKSVPETEQLAFINEANESILKASMILHESVDVDEHDEIRLELRRQDVKINLLLDMVSELLIQQNKIPEALLVKLTAGGIKCPVEAFDTKVVGIGEKLEIALYITPTTPRPLKIYAEVIELDGDLINVQFLGLSQSVQDWLEKLIFRHHRRTIAQSQIVS